MLQLLVLQQQAEREYLLGLLRGVSLDQLEGQENQCPLKDSKSVLACLSISTELGLGGIIFFIRHTFLTSHRYMTV